MSKRKILVAALAICLVAILSMGSLAWFNATDKVTNTFMFDDTDNDGTPDFEIEVFETKPDGTEVDALDFEDIAPNAKLPKDPTVRNKGDYDMYARLIVTVSDGQAWMDAAEKYSLTEAGKEYTVFETMIDKSAKWQRYGNASTYDSATDTLVYVYYYDEVIAEKGGVSDPLFTTVTIPKELQTEDMTFDGDFTVDVKGDAIQVANVDISNIAGTRNDASKAFGVVGWTAGTDYPQP